MRNLIISLGLATLLLCILGGCNSTGSTTDNETPDGGKKIKVGIVFDSGGLGDKSFNDSAWEGIQKAEKELGIEVFKVESKSENDYQTNLEAMADKGLDLVIAVGLNQETALSAVAPQFPETHFAIVDGTVEADNVRMLKFKEEEGSFLVGYIAGLTTKTNKIGFVGGMDIPLIAKFQYGYSAGAKTANPNIEILPAKFTGDWNSSDLALQAANTLFSSGADIVYHAAGRAGLGVIKSAEDNGKYAIGVDSDQYEVSPEHVLTSMIKRVDEAVFSTISDVVNETFTSGEVSYDLAQNGVSFSEKNSELIGKENLDLVAQIREKITSGETKVPASQSEYDTFLAQ